MTRGTHLMRKIMVVLLAFAVVFTYSVIPMNQAYAASSKKPAQVKITKAKATSTSSFKVTWKKAKRAKSIRYMYLPRRKKASRR